LEHVLWQKYKIPTIRLTHSQIYKQCELKDNQLFHKGKCISVVYFRSGYTPKDYPGEEQWNARLMIERSSAIKCPPIVFSFQVNSLGISIMWNKENSTNFNKF
jgi:glutathione synthase